MAPDEMNLMPEHDPTPEEIAEWERERREREEAELAPYREAARQRKETAEIAAEHDELISELLFESTMRDLEG